MLTHEGAGTDEHTPPPSSLPPRRHDVDWLRTIAMGLLIVFHIVLTFRVSTGTRRPVTSWGEAPA